VASTPGPLSFLDGGISIDLGNGRQAFGYRDDAGILRIGYKDKQNQPLAGGGNVGGPVTPSTLPATARKYAPLIILAALVFFSVGFLSKRL
jgi:hypothetical protein